MIVVYADDLTGAAELGGIGFRFGLGSEILTQGDPSPSVELLSIDMDSRSLSPQAAAERVRHVAGSIEALAPAWVYKKVDSVLRGNVAAEVSQLMEIRGATRCLLMPGNPSLGRVIRDGRYFVRGVPIDETDFRQDPQYPRHTSSVLDLLGESSQPIQVCRPHSRLPERGIVVGEASTPDDLSWWAAQAAADSLMAGAAEFFASLLKCRLTGGIPPRPRTAEPVRGRTLFLCGSASASTQAFVQRTREAGTPVVSLPREALTGSLEESSIVPELAARALEAFGNHRIVVLAIDLPVSRQAGAPGRLLEYLMRTADVVLDGCPVAEIRVEGGATAAALLARRGWTRLGVEDELSQGVVALRPSSPGAPRVTMKPGSYAW